MAAPHDARSRAEVPVEAPFIVVALGAIAPALTIAALWHTFASPDRMLLIALLHAAALAAAIAGEWCRRRWLMRSSAHRMLAMLAVLACLTTVSVWTLLGTWSTIGRCERHEEMLWLSDTSRVWYEGTACTEEERKGHLEEN